MCVETREYATERIFTMDPVEDVETSKNKMASRLRQYCSVFGCLMNSKDKPELSFFAVPKEPEKRVQWLQLISREDVIDKQTRTLVCETHFHPNDIVKNDRKRIAKGKVPTLNLPTKTKTSVQTQTDNACTLSKNAATQTDQSLKGASKENTQTTEEHACDSLLKTKSEPDPDFKLATSNINIFHKLCDRFLSKNLADLVKSETNLKSRRKENRRQGIALGPRSLVVLCEKAIKKYKLLPERKKFTPPETFSVVGGKPLRKRSERRPPESEVKKEKKAKKGKNPKSLAVLCKTVIKEYNLLPQCEETEQPTSNQLLIKKNTPARKRGRPLKSELQKKIKPTKSRGRPRKDQARSNVFGEASTSYSSFLEQPQDIRKIKVEHDLFLDQPPEDDPLREDEEEFTIVIKEENLEVEPEEYTRHVTIEVPQATAQGIVINPMAQEEIPGPGISSVIPKTMTVVMDEYQIFANSIAEQLRGLPPNRALLLQFDIQSMIDNEKQLMGHES